MEKMLYEEMLANKSQAQRVQEHVELGNKTSPLETSANKEKGMNERCIHQEMKECKDQCCHFCFGVKECSKRCELVPQSCGKKVNINTFKKKR